MKKEQEIDLEGLCYVLVQTNKAHPITNLRHELIWYPERGMTMLDTVQYRPYVKSIVTENPWIIACYKSENVRVWKKGRWSCPDRETYGASVDWITMFVLGVQQTIPSIAYDGGKAIDKIREALEA
jgi:hypothetical protein